MIFAPNSIPGWRAQLKKAKNNRQTSSPKRASAASSSPSLLSIFTRTAPCPPAPRARFDPTLAKSSAGKKRGSASGTRPSNSRWQVQVLVGGSRALAVALNFLHHQFDSAGRRAQGELRELWGFLVINNLTTMRMRGWRRGCWGSGRGRTGMMGIELGQQRGSAKTRDASGRGASCGARGARA